MLKRIVAKTTIIGALLGAAYLPNYFSQPQQTVVVEQGDYLSGIAKENLEEQGKDSSIEKIIEETNRISALNNKGTIEEYPWEKGYSCGDDSRDPNCIYEGEEIVLEEKAERNYGFLGFLGILGTVLLGRGRFPRKPLQADYSRLEALVSSKNDNPAGPADREDLNRYFSLKIRGWETGRPFVAGQIERYDSSIAPEAMRREIIGAYRDSSMTLAEASKYLGAKYGMNVSSSTISKYGRRELGVASRAQVLNKRIAA